MHTGLLYLSFRASYLRVSAIRIKLMQRNSHVKVTCILEIFAFDFQIDPWWFWRFFHNYSQSVLHFSSQTLSNSNIRTMKADSMSRTVSDCSWQCDYSIILTPKEPFLSSFCILKFWLMHLYLSITSKRIKLQMWDCAEKKALEKSFNLVTD